MVQIIKKISLEVSKPNIIQAIVAKQYDNNSRFLQVTLIHEGKKIEIAPTSTVTINAKRNDGEEKSFAGEANNDGTATVPLTYWMLELEGEVWCDVSVVDTEGRKLSSTKFDLQVEKASCSNGDITEDENYDVLVKLIEDVNKVKPDYFYDPTSENAQSGVAVAEALKTVSGIKEITEDTYVHELDNGIYSINCPNQEYVLHIDANDMYAPIIDGLIIVNYMEELNALQWQYIGMNTEYSNGMFIGYTDKESGDCYEYHYSSNFESVDNKTNKIKGTGSNLEYPTTRAVFDFVTNRQYETIYDITLEEETPEIEFDKLKLKEFFIDIYIPLMAENFNFQSNYELTDGKTRTARNLISGSLNTNEILNKNFKVIVENHNILEFYNVLNMSNFISSTNYNRVNNIRFFSTNNIKFPIGTKVKLEGIKTS